MDKTRDVRRAKPSRFSSANTHVNTQSVLIEGADFKKLRRDKVRRLSFVDRVCNNTLDSEMPCVQSDDEEDEYHPSATKSKRIKLPRKFFDDCQRVDHASVPRKLRSAITKRRRESVSPPFPEVRRLNHSANGIDPVKRDVIKKTKLKQLEEPEGSPGLPSAMPISKDEEEVAETLYALAEMFSDSDKTETAKSTVPEVEKGIQTPFTSYAPETVQQSLNTVGSAGETERIQFSNRRTEFDMHRYKQYSKSNCTKAPVFSKSSSANEHDSSNSSFPSSSQLSREIGLKRPLHNINLVSEMNKEIAVESVVTFKGQNKVQVSTRENRNYGLSSTSVHGAKTQGSPAKLSAAKLPTWLGISTSTAKSCSSRDAAIAKKESQSVANKKMWKRCSTHVYISRLIMDLKVTEAKDSLPLQPTRLTTHEGLTQGTISEEKKLHMIKDGSTGVIFTNDTACSGGEDSPSKLSNAILLHKRLHDDLQGSTNSGPNTTDKQSFNFFATLAGSCGLEQGSGGQVNGHRPEPSTQSNVPLLHQFTQTCTANPLSLPKNSHISTSFVDSAAAGVAQKVNIHLPPYLSNSSSGTSSMTGLQKQQQHQQWLWAAQLTASCKPEEFAGAASHVPNWQNSRQDFSHIMQYGQLIHPAALEVLGPRYVPVPTQQHLISSTSLFPQTRAQRYNPHQLSTSNMVNGGVYQSDSRAAMPLLCKEHI